jgi:hypothetical protein
VAKQKSREPRLSERGQLYEVVVQRAVTQEMAFRIEAKNPAEAGKKALAMRKVKGEAGWRNVKAAKPTAAATDVGVLNERTGLAATKAELKAAGG